ncbi:MAG TPA: hypothetical protein VFF64_19670 [Candidatus Eremiobacteraceae bacterium]|nr:hypothetical protein [Candidatus Eremiobacteraceae bacterium]
MKSTQTLKRFKFAAYMVLVVALSASGFASCGDSLLAMAASAASVESQSREAQPDAQSSSSDATNSSIVGLWHVQFIVGGTAIQEAYQIWNGSGTEVHNPNVDPRTGNVCLGVWQQAPGGVYKLAHRVWSYDASGNFLGTIHLREKITLSNAGNRQTGSFTLDFYDPSGTFQMEVAGHVTGERISVE